VLAAFYSKRVNGPGAVTSIAAGTIITVFWDKDAAFVHAHLPLVLAQRDAIFPALTAALLCLFGVSYATKPPSAKQLSLHNSPVEE
jgi:SSS family solute:Na+ symporter